MADGHDDVPDEEHKAQTAVLAVPESRALAQPQYQGCSLAPKNLTLHLPLPGPAAPAAALLPCFLCPAETPPCTAPLSWYPAMFYPLFHCYLPAQKAGACLLAKDFLLGSWRQIILAVSNNV